MTRPNLNAVALVADKFDGQIASTGFDVLRPVVIEPRWIFGNVRSQRFVEDMSEKVQGALYPAVKSKDVRDFIIPLPPLNEQKRIADKLDQLLTAVDSCKTRLDTIPGIIKRFRQSVLAAATSGELTADWREENASNQSSSSELHAIQVRKKVWTNQNSQHNEVQRVAKRAASFTVSALDHNDLPDGWCWACIEDVCNLVVDCHNKTAPYTSHGVPLVRTTNIKNGKLIWDEMRFVNNDTYEFWSRRCPPVPCDIVFTREAPMGEAMVVPDKLQICLGQRTMLFRPFHDLTSVSYLLFSIRDRSFLNRATEAAVGTGVKHLRVGDVSNLLVPLPPLAEQDEIVRRVDALFAVADRLEARYQTARAQVDQLTPSLLAKAFRGELVPQDPNDEPAEKLLERIRGAKDATPVKRQTKRKKLLTSPPLTGGD
jgi:type I restriction enzyme S subunit